MKINLIQYFEETVNNLPNKVAVISKDSSYTFIELKTMAQRLALRFDGINKPIAIYLPKSNEFMVSLLAVLYSGNIYVPLDIKNPKTRIESILNNLKPSFVITDNKNIENLKKCNFSNNIINIDNVSDDITNVYSNNYLSCIDEDPAYIIHTSGSTGTPKGVVISHRSIIDYIHWAIDAFDISEKEIIGNQAPFVFDNSTLDIYLMLFTGATLNLIPEYLFSFPIKLADYIKVNKINFIFWVPSVLVGVANVKGLSSIKLPVLKKVLFAGEVMPTKHLNYWIEQLSEDTIFANLYGPTEITVDCTYYVIDRKFEDNEVLPIGKPCRNTNIMILNSEDNRCKQLEQGELCVRGGSLALGYWNKPKKTKSVFVQNPLNYSYPEKIYRTGDIVFTNKNNEIIYVGRKDFQIKHLGYRIELGEIEHAVMRSFNSLVATVLYDFKKGEITLIYECEDDIPVSQFKIKLSAYLSKYMIPTQYIKMNKLPKNTSGKIDRSQLKTLID